MKFNDPFKNIFSIEDVLTPITIDARYDVVNGVTIRRYRLVYVFGIRVLKITRMEI